LLLYIVNNAFSLSIHHMSMRGDYVVLIEWMIWAIAIIELIFILFELERSIFEQSKNLTIEDELKKSAIIYDSLI
jgi:hypothetical protein